MDHTAEEKEKKKICASCKAEKSLEDFHRDRQRKCGFHSYCRTCVKERQKGYQSPTHNARNRIHYRTKRAECYRRDPLHYLWRTAYHRSKQNGVEFSIVKDDIKLNRICPIFGIELDVLTNNAETGMSLDRVDNTKGYVPGNCVVISRKANRLKGDGTVEQFKALIKYMETA